MKMMVTELNMNSNKTRVFEMSCFNPQTPQGGLNEIRMKNILTANQNF